VEINNNMSRTLPDVPASAGNSRRNGAGVGLRSNTSPSPLVYYSRSSIGSSN